MTKAEEEIRKAREADEAPTWSNQIRKASQLPDEELRRHASVSTNSRHRCEACFCCAALTVLERRREEQTEGYRTKAGHFRTRPGIGGKGRS